ncbi:hypothetical protein RFI_16600, partial [Reticulomyxa filosa]
MKETHLQEKCIVEDHKRRRIVQAIYLFEPNEFCFYLKKIVELKKKKKLNDNNNFFFFDWEMEKEFVTTLLNIIGEHLQMKPLEASGNGESRSNWAQLFQSSVISAIAKFVRQYYQQQYVGACSNPNTAKDIFTYVLRFIIRDVIQALQSVVNPKNNNNNKNNKWNERCSFRYQAQIAEFRQQMTTKSTNGDVWMSDVMDVIQHAAKTVYDSRDLLHFLATAKDVSSVSYLMRKQAIAQTCGRSLYHHNDNDNDNDNVDEHERKRNTNNKTKAKQKTKTKAKPTRKNKNKDKNKHKTKNKNKDNNNNNNKHKNRLALAKENGDVPSLNEWMVSTPMLRGNSEQQVKSKQSEPKAMGGTAAAAAAAT